MSFISCETAVARDREGGQVRTSRVALYSRRMTHREASAVDLLGREQVEDTLLQAIKTISRTPERKRRQCVSVKTPTRDGRGRVERMHAFTGELTHRLKLVTISLNHLQKLDDTVAGPAPDGLVLELCVCSGRDAGGSVQGSVRIISVLHWS